MRGPIAAALLLFGPWIGVAGETKEQAAADAAQYFQEAKALCERDGGTLWGQSLCGPMLLVDPESRDLFASQDGSQQPLEARAGFFVGKMPPTVNVANTATEWNGVKWTMLMLPLPADEQRRAVLLVHEMWHRVQEQLQFPSSSARNAHLDTRDGRYWLQLEWRALAAALTSTGAQKEQAILDAEIFRAQRRAFFESAAEEERAMEMHEGLAEYAGVHLGTREPRRFVATVNLKEAPEKQTFVRSFAYATGPAYGLLLDESAPGWPKTVSNRDDLGALLLAAAKLKLPTKSAAAAQRRAKAYDGDSLAVSENKREQNRREQEKVYRTRLVAGPILEIPLRKANMQFDPRNVMPLAEQGTVYPTIRIVDVWGVLEVRNGGALISAAFSKVTVPAPSSPQGSKIVTADWSLELAPKWAIEAGPRPGSYRLTERKQ